MLEKLFQLKTYTICILAFVLTLSITGCDEEEDEGAKLSKLVTSAVGPNNAPVITTPFTIIQTVGGEKESVELAPSVFPVRFDLTNKTDQFLFVSSIIATIDYIDAAGAFQTAESAFSIGDVDTPEDEDFIPISIIEPYSDIPCPGGAATCPGFDTTAALEPGSTGGFGGIIWFNGMPTPEVLGTDFIVFNVQLRFVGYFSTSDSTRDVTSNFIHSNNMTASATF